MILYEPFSIIPTGMSSGSNESFTILFVSFKKSLTAHYENNKTFRIRSMINALCKGYKAVNYFFIGPLFHVLCHFHVPEKKMVLKLKLLVLWVSDE